MIKHLIKARIAQATPREIVRYCQKYNVPVTEQQAAKLLSFIKQNNIDPFSERDREKTFNFVERNIGKKEANDAKVLLESLAKEFNLDHYL